MYIGKINDKASPIQIEVAYYKPNTDKPLGPDETYPSPLADNALTNGVAWRWGTVLDTGVDIRFELSQACFVDACIIQLDRESHIHNAFAYLMNSEGEWRKVGQVTDRGENTIKIEVGLKCSALMIRLEGCLKRIAIDHVDLYGSVCEPVSVYPVPKQMKQTSQWMTLPQEVIITSDQTLGIKAFEYLKEKVTDVQLTQDPSAAQSAIRIHTVSEACLPTEAYSLKVEAPFVDITASDAKGFLYAMQTLVQLMDGDQILICAIEDSPFKSLRGIHIGLPPREEIPFIKRFIKNLMVPMRLNTLFLQMTAGMRFESHPAINEAWVNAVKKSDSGEWPILHHGDMIAGGEVLEKSEV
ncbi:MAG: glycoside hydrolase family 20 zincin-like fold domain-containing protein, partial [Cellulosilyticaceae bacterium]